jgi:hypothetical protein
MRSNARLMISLATGVLLAASMTGGAADGSAPRAKPKVDSIKIKTPYYDDANAVASFKVIREGGKVAKVTSVKLKNIDWHCDRDDADSTDIDDSHGEFTVRLHNTFKVEKQIDDWAFHGKGKLTAGPVTNHKYDLYMTMDRKGTSGHGDLLMHWTSAAGSYCSMGTSIEDSPLFFWGDEV